MEALLCTWQALPSICNLTSSRPVIRDLCPSVCIVSFKLETDESLLSHKIKKAFAENGSNLIVGNLLQTRLKCVMLATPTVSFDIERPEDLSKTLEDALVEKLVSIL